jgi:leucyl aminopeptidase
MKFTSLPSIPTKFTSELIVVTVNETEISKAQTGKKPTNTGSYGTFTFLSLNLLVGGKLRDLLSKRSFKAQSGESVLISGLSEDFPNILVIGFDTQNQDVFSKHETLRFIGALISSTARELHVKSTSILTSHLSLEKESSFCAMIEGISLGGYEYSQYKSKKADPLKLEEIIFVNHKKIDERILQRAITLSESTSFARDLINMPPNDCTPPYLVSVAKTIASKGKLKIQIFERAQLEKMGAHSFLSVSKGTSLPPFLIKLTYQPIKKNSKTKVVSLVGKGITYDTGGYSLKPGDSMIGMKGDMAGAACVLGVMQAVSTLKPNIEVRGYIPTTENMINGEATRVGDIVKAMNGKTIEILNTDAEGRLILADALTLACKDKANIVIDIATLTGACMVALGMQYAGLFSDDEKLSKEIIDQGSIAGERFWQLPLAPEYAASIKSPVADLKNISGNRWAGATIAALFLKEFVTDTRWAHLDIAGPSDSDRSSGYIKQGGVGFAVRTLTRMILNQR